MGRLDFGRQIIGASYPLRASMMSRAKIVPLDADEASEVAECLAADVLDWV